MKAGINIHRARDARVEEKGYEGIKWVNIIIGDDMSDDLEFEITLYGYTKARLLEELSRED